MPKFISDEEMAKLDAQAKPTGFISDEEMLQREQKVAPADKSHDLLPFLKDTAQGIGSALTTGVNAAGHAIAHPIETAEKAGDWVADVASDPVGDIKGVYRAARSIPIAGEVLSEAVAGLSAVPERFGAVADRMQGKQGPSGFEAYDKAKKEFLDNQAAEDARHAKDSPVANTAQKLAGTLNPLGLNVPANVLDTFYKSIKAGNTYAEAFQDARNALVLMKGPEYIAKGATKVAKKLPAAVTGVTDDIADYYKANHEAVDAARPLQNVTDDLIDSTKTFRREMSNQSTEGYNALKNSGMSATASQLDEPITARINRLSEGAVTSPAKATVSELSSLRESIAEEMAKSGNTLGASGLDKVKTFVRQIDDLIDYDAVKNGRATSRDEALMSIRRNYDDLLKNSPEYQEVMSGLSTKADALDDVASQLKNPKASDNFLGRIAKNKDPRGSEALANLDENMGTNFGKEVKDAGVKDFFTRENSRGTRNTLFAGATGALLGGAIGLPPWVTAAAAATSGPVIDKFGRQIYQQILKAQAQNPELMAKYANAINTAGKAGPASLVAMHRMLQKDPDYQAAVGNTP